ncbi:EAL domain-containing protein [Chelatococcus sambhunathii]|uniref:EAL domain-containing protein n=1 Tax=Chelatococcus sambhunathii TaxID=363953 RepID=A0ABU1DGA3_9HYPH|nr:EAL domain-containing protein [Chelatococcus sambhunathii]MDR4307075.1 EAL domain-containing protein [Chelatococcus sambhunathii]
MTLGRRALLLIFPVVLAGYAIAAGLVYVTQRDSQLRLEQARLDQQLDHLRVLFENDDAVDRNFLHAITGGGALRSFLQETDDSFRSHALGVRLQQAIESVAGDKRALLTFSVMNSALELEHYFENSTDPFAEIDPEQLAFAKRVMAGRGENSWAFLAPDGRRPWIVHAEFVDPLTMNRPLASRVSAAVLLMAAIRPERFLAMKRGIESEYGARLEISDRPLPAADGLSMATELMPGAFARMTPAESYFASRLWPLKFWLSLGTVLVSLLSISLLIALVRRFITRPIARLDRQLTEVLAGERASISIADEAGEIGSLSSNMKNLHDDFIRSLRGIQTASWTDTLTGISNRAHFNVLAAEALESSARRGSQCGLLFIDVDNFKFVNDRFGHEIGDGLLRELAGRFAEVVAAVSKRETVARTIFARLSGDEFAVLVESDDAAATAEEVARGILAASAIGFSERFPIGVSIGVASTSEGSTASLDELLADADAAMYEAKAAGKNRTASFSRELLEKRSRERAIRDALRVIDPDEEFRLVYMPIVDVEARVIACEALLRWTSPALGDVRPDEFIPIAERSGLFAAIDRWVIDKALADHMHIATLFGEDAIVSINVSSAELGTTYLGDYLAERLSARSVHSGHVEIELTETFAAGSRPEVGKNVEALRATGVRIAIDDFGAGYTSIQQVTEYSADTIKLDRFFAERLCGSRETLRALVALCHAQGMRVVVEGIDSPAKIALFSEVGCDGLQGYEICKPLDLGELGVWALARLADQAKQNSPRVRHAV